MNTSKEKTKLIMELSIKDYQEQIQELERILNLDLDKFDGKIFDKKFTKFLGGWKINKLDTISKTFITHIELFENSLVSGNTVNILEIHQNQIRAFNDIIIDIKLFKKEIQRKIDYFNKQINELNEALKTIDEYLEQWLILKKEVEILRSKLNHNVYKLVCSDFEYLIRS